MYDTMTWADIQRQENPMTGECEVCGVEADLMEWRGLALCDQCYESTRAEDIERVEAQRLADYDDGIIEEDDY